MLGYKFLQENNSSQNDASCIWELNKWKKFETPIELCQWGFHACETPLESLEYIYGSRWYQVEARGNIIKGDNKFVASEMRIIKELPIKKILPLFAIECAEHTLSNFEKIYPNDNRPRKVIEGVKLFLNNKITKDELENLISAARSARAVTWSTAQAKAARSTAQAKAARSAAWSAASAAESAKSAAESAESAAWSAASAAESAAESATESAESARSAAWSAESARSAAWSAEINFQNKKLKEIINMF